MLKGMSHMACTLTATTRFPGTVRLRTTTPPHLCTPRPDAVIELNFNNPQQLTTTTTATPPENDATTKEDGTIDLKVPGEETYFFLFFFFVVNQFINKNKVLYINHEVKASKDVNFNMDLIFY